MLAGAGSASTPSAKTVEKVKPKTLNSFIGKPLSDPPDSNLSLYSKLFQHFSDAPSAVVRRVHEPLDHLVLLEPSESATFHCGAGCLGEPGGHAVTGEEMGLDMRTPDVVVVVCRKAFAVLVGNAELDSRDVGTFPSYFEVPKADRVVGKLYVNTVGRLVVYGKTGVSYACLRCPATDVRRGMDPKNFTSAATNSGVPFCLTHAVQAGIHAKPPKPSHLNTPFSISSFLCTDAHEIPDARFDKLAHTLARQGIPGQFVLRLFEGPEGEEVVMLDRPRFIVSAKDGKVYRLAFVIVDSSAGTLSHVS